MTVYDLVVIGSGSGGSTAARLAASMGARVALIERSPEQLGGAWLHGNDVPSKALVYASRAHRNWKTAKQYIQQACQAAGHASISASRYRDEGVHLYFGEARFLRPTKIKANKETVAGRHVVVASGATPHVPSVPGLKKAGFLTLHTLLATSRLPGSLTIIGGGMLAVEAAFALQRLGCKVTIVEHSSHILSHFDTRVSEHIKNRLQAAGVTVYTSASIVGVHKTSRGHTLEARYLGGPLTLRSGNVLVAAGQEAVLPRGLNNTGVKVSKSGVAVGAHWRTGDKRIYAIGDVVQGNGHQTLHAAQAARQAVKHALLGQKSRFTQQPQVVFSEPEVAHVGATAAELMKGDEQHQVYTQALSETCYGQVAGKDGFIRVICRPNGTVVGGTIVADGASEAIGYLAMAVNKGWSLDRLAAQPLAYPTLAAVLAQIASDAGYHGAPTGASITVPLRRALSL